MQHFQLKRFDTTTSTTSSVLLSMKATINNKEISLNATDNEETNTIPKKIQRLSMNPPLWVSVDPILSSDECDALSKYPYDEHSPLSTLQQRLDRIIGRSNTDRAIIPRLLEYEPNEDDEEDDALPDGLHVDSADDGGMESRRYLSVIVYLTDSSSAATTFPLAIPESLSSTNFGDDDEAAVKAAKSLLESDIHHTQCCTNDDEELAASILERHAVKIYRRNSAASPSGIRVLPRKGHLVMFSFVQPDGSIHPRSWHSSEALFPDEEKRVLTFFYTLSPNLDLSRIEFGSWVQNEIQDLLNN